MGKDKADVAVKVGCKERGSWVRFCGGCETKGDCHYFCFAKEESVSENQ